tara:strand:- start:36 stop:398 length:363 start_codon:yes stop_codon:yes gene_type:complete
MSKQNVTHKKRQMLVALEQNLCVVSKAAREVGINRKTHYDWMNKDSRYKRDVEDLENVTLDFAESELHRQIKDGNTTATIFLLKTKGKGRGYVEKNITEVQGDIKSRLIEWTPAKDKEQE